MFTSRIRLFRRFQRHRDGAGGLRGGGPHAGHRGLLRRTGAAHEGVLPARAGERGLPLLSAGHGAGRAARGHHRRAVRGRERVRSAYADHKPS